MPESIERIDEKIEPLVNDIDNYIRELDAKRLLTFYDADWGGIPTQVIFDKICENLHGIRPKSHWITYLHTDRPIEFSRNEKPNDVCFLEYEPHGEVHEICDGAERVGIFGHHKDRDDIRELCRIDNRFTYFNPREVKGAKAYGRDLPIFYPFSKVAENHDIDVSFIEALALKGYGYRGLYREMFSEKFKERQIDHIIEDVNLLTSYHLDNCFSVVKALRRSDKPNHVEIKKVRQTCSRNRLAEIKNRTITESILNSVIVGDVQIFPIKTEFQLIKSFVADLDSARRYQGISRYRTTICIQYPNNISERLRKVSIRTSWNIDVPKLLKEAHEKQRHKNFGGHDNSGGYVSNNRDTIPILEKLLRSYFSETRQLKNISPDELNLSVKLPS